MRLACLLVLTGILVVGGATAASATPANECQPSALSKTIRSSVAPSALSKAMRSSVTSSHLLAQSSVECTIDNFFACPIGSPEDPDYCPCSWVKCSNWEELACGYLY